MNRLIELETQLTGLPGKSASRKKASKQAKPQPNDVRARVAKAAPSASSPAASPTPDTVAKRAPASPAKAQSFSLAPPRRAMAFAVSLPWTGTIDKMRAHLRHNGGRTEWTTTSSTVKIDFTSAWSAPHGRPDLFTMPTHVLISIYEVGTFSNSKVGSSVRFAVDSSTVQTGVYTGLSTSEKYVLDIQFDPFLAIPSIFPALTGTTRVYV